MESFLHFVSRINIDWTTDRPTDRLSTRLNYCNEREKFQWKKNYVQRYDIIWWLRVAYVVCVTKKHIALLSTLRVNLFLCSLSLSLAHFCKMLHTSWRKKVFLFYYTSISHIRHKWKSTSEKHIKANEEMKCCRNFTIFFRFTSIHTLKP